MTVERAVSLGGLAVLLAGFVAVSIWTPGSSGFFPPCPVHALTGLYCPGCGSTRMLYYLAHAQPWTAFRQNPLGFVILPFLVPAMILSALELPPPAAVRRVMAVHGYRLVIALLVVVTVYTVLRNLPAAPFCQLAPGGC
ncbi:hypothetical protein ABAC460_05855 [Asticcacaulis sp. AC460]|uniref:DUF2752 domain-containing protein n=1 Tax=Asticcacaulis sp. AC460 TaxID=1282360 RepID=UPI0003C3BD4C|nr:DUF2752 domain-containing protein [Asticcacaulis sp. AC460]ESQ91507.1 hypothetical protein ABAC460_05855 [Asticcacaulis sp. AC460]